MKTIRNIAEIAFWTILMLLFVVAFAKGVENNQKQYDEYKQKETEFINNCTSQGKRIDQIGSSLSGYKLICNPK